MVNKKNDNDTKKIFTMVVLVFTLMICTTGATYAYFALSADNSTAINGVAATASLTLEVTKEAPAGAANSAVVMVPQLKSNLSGALAGHESNGSCVDANSNKICQVYKIVLTNESTATVALYGTIQFMAPQSDTAGQNTFTNLHWRKITDATTLGSNTSIQIMNSADGAITSSTSATDCSTTGNHCSKAYNIVGDGTACTASSGDGCNKITVTSGGVKTYYIIVWINETNTNQNDTDKGQWQAFIKFQSENGNGITSTIT